MKLLALITLLFCSLGVVAQELKDEPLKVDLEDESQKSLLWLKHISEEPFKVDLEDDREVIMVTQSEKAFILERMRRMLETLTSVAQVLHLDASDKADNLVQNLINFTEANYPKEWYNRMPKRYKQLEDRLNKRWSILAVDTKDKETIIKNSMQVMVTCNACHREYKIGLR